MNKTPALEMQALTIRFGAKTILERFSLRLEAGERATLTGRSGSGKSSLLRALLGFVLPEAGSIAIEGQRLDAASVWRLRRSLAYVAQEPDLGPGSVREALERPFSYRANAALRANLERAPEFFERFALQPHLLDSAVADLSGGEKQRVALVLAILLERPIFLLDEATSALDKTARKAVAEYFHSRLDATVLAVSHDVEDLRLDGPVIDIEESAREHRSESPESPWTLSKSTP